MYSLPFTHIRPEIPHSQLIWVPGGRFWMGSNDEEAFDREKPVHEVTVPSFAIGQYPVTQALWAAIMGDNPSYFKGFDRPVELVSWDDIQNFLNQLNQSDAVKLKGWQYRLPSEAEWEYAARGGPEQKSYWYVGSNNLNEVGWYDENSHGQTHPVGLKLPNSLALYDLSGNVWEWCEDQWHENYLGAPNDGNAWVDREEKTPRMLRGGGWLGNRHDCCPSSRLYIHPAGLDSYYGFRVVLCPPPVSLKNSFFPNFIFFAAVLVTQLMLKSLLPVF